MSQFITTAFVQEYTTKVQLLLQQKGSRFRTAVMTETHVGKAAVPVEQFGPVTATKRIGRYTPLTPQDTPQDRRWVYPNDYDWNDLIDKVDRLRLLIDPDGAYVQNGGFAMGRALDDEIIAAFFGTANTGESGGTAVTFPAAQQVSVNVGGTASGMNVQKFLAANQILMAKQVDLTEPKYASMSAKQVTNLFNEIQVTSTDFASTKVLTDGKLTGFLGYEIIPSERLPINGSSYRRCPFWVKSGMHGGMWQDISTNVSIRNDLAGLPTQVYVYGTFGATRLEEGKIVEVPCAEA